MNSKKLVSAVLTATTVLWMVGAAALPLANAQSTASLQAQIAALLAQIQTLQSQLGTSSGGTSAMTYNFTSDLTVGSTGSQVNSLQQFLIAKGYLTGVSAPTGYFGALTQKALAAFQAANGITPSVGYFGPKSRAFVNSMSTGTTGTGTTGTGTTGTGTTVTAPATGLQVSLASTNPAAGSLITTAPGTTGSGAARVPVLGVSLTAGNSGAVTVSAINFHKTGVLADSAIGGAYLIQNGQVVAQYNSISNGVISFSGLSLSIPAGQTENYQLAVDVAGQLSAGNTTGFSLNAASDVTAWDTNNTAITPSGSFPLTGNIFTVTSVSNPGLASVAVTTSSVQTSVNAGTQGNVVGSWNFNVQNNKVFLNSIAFHVIGSANMANLQNVKLTINGSPVGATLAAVGSSNVAYFNLTSSPVSLNTGNNIVQVMTDVMGSPNLTFQWEILNGFDIYAIDSQYNVPVSVAVTSGADASVQIQPGQINVQQDSTTPTGNIAKGVSQVTLAKFDLYASGEATKVKFLGFSLAFTGLNQASDTALSQVVKNIALTDDAGQQVGSTINTPPTGNTCDNTTGASGVGSNGVWTGATTTSASVTYVDCFGTSASPINYVVPANTTRVLSLKADIQSTANFGTITAGLQQETNNLQGQISSNQNSSGAVSGSALSLSNSSLTATANPGFGTQSVSKNTSDQEIGSYNLTASSAEGVNVNNLAIMTNSSWGAPLGNFSSLEVVVNGTQFGTTVPNVTPGTTYTFSGSAFNIQAGQTVTVNVFANISSQATGGTTGGATSLTGLSGTGQISNAAISLPSQVQGQNVSVSNGTSITITANSASNPSVTQVAMGTPGQILAAYNFQETQNVENVKLSTLDLVDVLSTSTVVTSTANVLPSFTTLQLNWTNSGTPESLQATYQGTTTVAGQTAFLYQFSFGNSSNFVIPRNGTLQTILKGSVNSLSAGNVTDGSVHTFEIATSTYAPTATSTAVAMGSTSNIPASVTITAANGNAQTILQNTLGFTFAPQGATQGRSKSSADELATLTFAPSNGGVGVLTTTTITFSGNAATSTTAADAQLALVSPSGQGFVAPYISPVASTSCNGSNSCTATFSFTGTQGLINGAAQTYALILNDANGTSVAGGTNYVSLYATIANSSAILYTDGNSGTTVSGVGLPSSFLFPIQIFGAQFSQGS
jgi:hypothetical protein